MNEILKVARHDVWENLVKYRKYYNRLIDLVHEGDELNSKMMDPTALNTKYDAELLHCQIESNRWQKQKISDEIDKVFEWFVELRMYKLDVETL